MNCNLVNYLLYILMPLLVCVECMPTHTKGALPTSEKSNLCISFPDSLEIIYENSGNTESLSANSYVVFIPATQCMECDIKSIENFVEYTDNCESKRMIVVLPATAANDYKLLHYIKTLRFLGKIVIDKNDLFPRSNAALTSGKSEESFYWEIDSVGKVVQCF